MSTLYDRAYFEDGTKSNYQGYPELEQYKDYARLVAEKNPTSVLDVGCAKGYVVNRLRERGIVAYGVDVSEYAADNKVCEWVQVADVTEGLPFKDGQFDLVVSFDVLEHIPEEKVPFVISEMERVGKRQYHHITYRENNPGKDITHVTLRPMDWWQEKFKQAELVESY